MGYELTPMPRSEVESLVAELSQDNLTYGFDHAGKTIFIKTRYISILEVTPAFN